MKSEVSVFDAYEDICKMLVKLCPCLVPKALWGISLARLARLNHHIGDAICESCADIVGQLRKFWLSFRREGACDVCGSLKALEVDEDWRYQVIKEEEGVRGRAILRGVRSLCERCHLGKHLGYASAHGRLSEAIEHLANVNNVSSDVVKNIVLSKLAERWKAASGIRKWEVKIEGLPGLDDDFVKKLEYVLNAMVREGFYIDERWLWYVSKENALEVMKLATKETGELLKELGGALSSLSSESLGHLIDLIEEKLKRSNIIVLRRELEWAIRYAKEDFVKAKHFHGVLTGKWMTFSSADVAGKLLSKIIRELKEEGLDFEAKTRISEKGAYPVIIYVPSFLALDLVAKVGEVIKSVMKRHKLSKAILFKPDVFTKRGIYSKAGGLKPYIYKAE